jgi:LmbE family N-acetylglucosaminyl deacetylase
MRDTPHLLVIAPHPDDEVLGTAGTMARFARQGGDVTVGTIAAHMPPLYSKEVHERTVEEAKQAHRLLGVKESIFLDNPAVLLGNIGVPEFNGMVFNIIKKVSPDVLLIPYVDRHVDHRMVFEACMVASRPVDVGRYIKICAAYETISETHWNAPHLEPNFTPNWCIDISEYIDLKIDAMRCYQSQLQTFPQSRSVEALKALALFRGSQAGMGFAEAYHLLRMSFAPDEMFGF